MSILETKDLVKTYGSGPSSVNALKSINLKIDQGEFVGIIGPSGSGKSSLLHLLGGLDRPTSGTVTVEGKDIYTLTENELAIYRRRRFGFVFQFFNLIPVLTVEENITLPLILEGKTIDTGYINELIGMLGLSEKRSSLPNTLSGGQQQRTAIGRALANKPSILFTDEPTGNLDSKTSREVLDLLYLSAKKYHQTVVVITHDPRVAAGCDRVITIEDGCLVSDEVVKA